MVTSTGDSVPPRRAPPRSPSGPLPACEYKDKRTRYYNVKDWRKTLLDTNLRIKRDYAPKDLVSVSRANLKGTGKVRKVIIADLRAMAERARGWQATSGALRLSLIWHAGRHVQLVGAPIGLPAGSQVLCPTWPLRAPAGHDHRFHGGAGPAAELQLRQLQAGPLDASNAWKFGFINPYPKGKTKVSCYGYEPWHWRYVGRDLAARIYRSGQVPRRYYWRNFETAP